MAGEARRYRIMSDGNHDYYIPLEFEKQFEAWVEAYEEGTEDVYEGMEFDEYRINGRFTFTDPRCK